MSTCKKGDGTEVKIKRHSDGQWGAKTGDVAGRRNSYTENIDRVKCINGMKSYEPDCLKNNESVIDSLIQVSSILCQESTKISSFSSITLI